MATFFAVYPDGIAWLNDRDGGADVVLFGQVDPAPINVDAAVERFERADNVRAAKSLRDIGFPSNGLGVLADDRYPTAVRLEPQQDL